MFCLKRFLDDRRGSTFTLFAFAAPIAIGLGAFAIDYSSWTGQQARLQAVADAAALAAAKELKLTRASNDHVLSVATGIVLANFAGAEAGTVKVAAVTQGGAVTVDLAQPRVSYFASVFGTFDTPLAASATARMIGAQRICVLALETASEGALSMEANARLDGNGCSVTSNSLNTNSIRIAGAARVSASTVCVAGGARVANSAFVQPAAITNCAPLQDPLAARPAPTFGACDHTSVLDITTDTVLSPGVYCADVRIGVSARVTLQPGLYVFRGAKLWANANAEVRGDHVGIYASGANAGVQFWDNVVVNLKAPKTGPMAGILIREDANGPAGGRSFDFYSNNIENVTGVIYLPRSEIAFDADQPIADASPWTAIVANRIDIRNRSTVVLNTNYGATDVPVPDGIATRNAEDIVSLTR